MGKKLESGKAKKLTVTSSEMCSEIADKLNLPVCVTKQIVKEFFRSVVEKTNDGVVVTVHLFGKFEMKSFAPRKFFIPSTKETIAIDVQKRLVFRSSKKHRTME